MNCESQKSDIVTILARWESQYGEQYAKAIPAWGTDRIIYNLEKQHAPSTKHVPTSWIARILRTHFDYSREEVSENITKSIRELVHEGMISEYIGPALDLTHHVFDGP